MFPKEASEHDTIGALVFAQYYFRAFDWGIATSDSYLLRQISEPGCKACKRAIDAVDASSSGGRHLQGGRIRLESAAIVTGEFRFRGDLVVEVKTTQGAQTVVASTGSVSGRKGPSQDDALVFVMWRNGWHINEVGASS